MSALKGLRQLKISNELLLSYKELYTTVGLYKEKIEYLVKFNNEYNDIAKTLDITCFINMFFKDAKIKESRLNKILKNQDLGNNLTKDEILALNIKNIFYRANSSLKFNFDSVELIDLAKLLYNNYYSSDSPFKTSEDKKEYTQKLDTLFREYKEIRNETEPLAFSVCFLIDFIKMSPFKNDNEAIGLIFFYCMLYYSDITCFRFTSFFNKFISYKNEFDEALTKSFYLYDSGYSDSSYLINLFIKLIIESHKDVDEIYNVVIFNKQLKKSMTVAEVIYSLGDTFTKKEIMDRLPSVSMSTIDRKLKEMQMDGKISSFGVGRNAKWVLLDHRYKKEEN